MKRLKTTKPSVSHLLAVYTLVSGYDNSSTHLQDAQETSHQNRAEELP